MEEIALSSSAMAVAENDTTELSSLLTACRKGQHRAQLEVYDRFAHAMFNSALRILNDSFEAEDVMQEAMVTAFERLGELNDAVMFPAWLKRIVINRSINRVQQRKTYIDFLHSYADEAEAQPDPVEPTLSVDAVKRAMKELPDGYRIILSLYLLEGYDHEEISEILDISSATSRSQYNRGKQKLRMILKENHG